MIKITCDDGSPRTVKIIETESGVDLANFVSDLQIGIDPQTHLFVATVKILRPKIQMNTLAKYLLAQREDHVEEKG